MATPKKKTATNSPGNPPAAGRVVKTTLVLPVTLTTERRAVAGAELAWLNTEHRDLNEAKKKTAKVYAQKIEKNETRKIPLEQALEAAEQRAKDGVREPLTVPLEIDCEAREVPGRPDHYDIYRLDAGAPRFVHQVHLPRAPVQEGLPGVDAPSATPPDEQALFEEGLRAALEGVSFPEDDETPGDDKGGADGGDDDPLG